MTTFYEPKVARALRRFGDPPPRYRVRPETSDWKAVREVWERNAYLRHGVQPEPGQVWVDGGACVGAFADLAARAGAVVIAYEPEPTNAALAMGNLRRHDGRVAIRQAALVAPALAGTATLHVNSAPLALRRHSVVKARRASTPLEVEAVDLEAALAVADGAKLNIEGAEIEALTTWTPPERLTHLAVEWSFDVDPRIAVLDAACARLEAAGFTVHRSRKTDGLAAWPPNYFPPQLYLHASR